MTRALDETCRDWRHERALARPLFRGWVDARYAVAVCGVLARMTTSDLARPAIWRTLLTTVAVSSVGSLLLILPTTMVRARPLYVETVTWMWLQLLLVPSMLVLSMPVACALMSAARPERMRNLGIVVLVTLVAVSLTGWWTPMANRVFRYEILRAANEVGPGTFGTLRQGGLPEVSITALVRLAASPNPMGHYAWLTALKRVSFTLVAPVAIGIGLMVRRLAFGRRRAGFSSAFSMLAVGAVFPASSFIGSLIWLGWDRGRTSPPLLEGIGASSVILVALLELIVLTWWAGRSRRVEARA